MINCPVCGSKSPEQVMRENDAKALKSVHRSMLYHPEEETYFVRLSAVLKVVFLAGVIFLFVRGCDNAYALEMDMAKIAMIESSGNVLAHNKKDDSRGLYQITPICLKEYNNFHPKAGYSMDDLWNASISTKIAKWYLQKRIPQMLKAYKIPVNTTTVIASYNWGIGGVVKWYRSGADFNKLPKVTVDYLRKYGA